jgi:uncharacterized SAM-binding protein YcdF (DUF218 family)
MSTFFYVVSRMLTQPFFVLLTIALLGVAASWRKRKGSRLGITFLALIAIWLLSTPLVAHGLESMLAVAPSPASQVPEVIEIPSGGSRASSDPELVMLSEPTHERVLQGVQWWKQRRSARLVMAGADRNLDGTISPGALQLMRRTAIQEGVPAAVISLESRSTDTREHPIELRRLPGITRATKIGLVTSCTHERRAACEFRRHFDTVILHPVPCAPLETEPFFAVVLPSPGPLERSTYAAHELIGMAWYAVRRLPGR